MDNAFFDYISSSALSLVVSGNTGISPFLTLFVLGLTEMMNPELLNMGATMEVALASWWSIGILGVLTLGETIGKCIPVIDELIDSAEVFVVPAISVLASLATLGVLPVPGGSTDDAGLGQSIDVLGMFGGGGSEVDDYGGGDYRLLQVDNTNTTLVGSGDDDDGNDFGEGFMMFTKVSLVIAGVGISLLIHFFKMLVRMSSLMCSGGCCQPCLTVTEYALVIFGVIFSILAPVFAVLACIVMLVAAGYAINVKFCTKKKEDDDDDDSDTNSNTVSKQKKKSILGSLRRNSSNTSSNNNNNNSGVDDIEKQKGSLKKSKRNTSITAPGQPSEEEIFAQAEFVSTLPSSVSAPTDNQHENKPEVNATTY